MSCMLAHLRSGHALAGLPCYSLAGHALRSDRVSNTIMTSQTHTVTSHTCGRCGASPRLVTITSTKSGDIHSGQYDVKTSVTLPYSARVDLQEDAVWQRCMLERVYLLGLLIHAGDGSS